MSNIIVRTLPIQAELGEGLHWDDTRQCLWMVDIHGRRIIQWDTLSTTWREWQTPQRVGWVIPLPGSDQLMAGFQEGFARIRLHDAGTLDIEWVARPFGDRHEQRLNDAKMDSSGAIWAGSLNNNNEQQDDGCLFRLDPSGQVSVHDTGYKVCNGPAISPDERLMLHTDSARRTIYAFDLDVQAGSIGNKRVWKRFTEAEGYPDGMTFDASGNVWIAHWSGACVSCFALDGRQIHRIPVPAPHVTNVCFGGLGRNRLFATTARTGVEENVLKMHPESGNTFELLLVD